ncbi:zinc-ribbon domain-containing protein [Rhodococcus opacus]|uniref:zinc-ribbon domain-containing protein n=1 Tax=Rhodococcus opacus TaxID=37919 RepID=UPI003D2CDBC1
MPARVIPGRTDLTTLRPEVAAEWHPIRNTRQPCEFSPGSGFRAWWQCDQGHAWEALIKKRTAGRGCPVCAGKLVEIATNDLASLHPSLAQEWDITQNDRGPTEVTPGSRYRAQWVCRQGHRWSAPVVQRASKRNGCPVCSGRVPNPGETDFATTHPELAAEWDQDLNLTRPEQVKAASTAMIWWKCAHGHTWQAMVRTRIRGAGCKVCSQLAREAKRENEQAGIKRRGLVSVAETDVAAHWSTRNESPASRFARMSNQKAWWTCGLGHEYRATIAHVTGGSGCPYCAGQRVLKGFNDLQTTHPTIAASWHHERNSLSPTEITKGSMAKVWWRCGLGHEWECSTNNRVTSERGCAVCCGIVVLAGFNDLESQRPGVAKDWHPCNELKPSDVHHGSARKVWWMCPLGHEWKTSVNKRNGGGQGCPICANRQVLRGFNDLASNHPHLLAEWMFDRNHPLVPTQITSGCNRRVWWQCSKGHQWYTSPNKRAHENQGCARCVAKNTSRREITVCSRIAAHFSTPYSGPTSVPGARGQVDLLIPDLRTIVEYDGWYWHKDRLERDIAKTNTLISLGYSVIRIREIYASKQLPKTPGSLIYAQWNDPPTSVASQVIRIIEGPAMNTVSSG